MIATADEVGLIAAARAEGHGSPLWGHLGDMYADVGDPREAGARLGITFAWIPPGSFLMGSPPEEVGRYIDETQHSVELTRGFYMGTHQVTQAQWQAVMGSNPSHFKGTDLPVDSVSWDDCQEFCATLSAGYRLPTEAEWEYACRAGTTTPFNFGASLSSTQANFNGDHPYGGANKGPNLYRTCPVGSYPANGFGLFDMHGNVWEWCSDWHGDYPKEVTADPSGPFHGTARVLRGGCWCSPGRYCRSADRRRIEPDVRGLNFGFRLALCLD